MRWNLNRKKIRFSEFSLCMTHNVWTLRYESWFTLASKSSDQKSLVMSNGQTRTYDTIYLVEIEFSYLVSYESIRGHGPIKYFDQLETVFLCSKIPENSFFSVPRCRKWHIDYVMWHSLWIGNSFISICHFLY